MKYFFYLLITIFPTITSYAQTTQDWDAFGQRIDVTAYKGGKFHLQAAVKVQLVDSTAEGEIWARIDNKDSSMGFFYNMMDKPIRSKEWRIYTIEGKIDKKAKWLNIGGLYQRNGVFSFDDFQLSVKGKRGKWNAVPLVDGGFEKDTGSVNEAWNFFHKRKGFTIKVAKTNSYKRNQHLEITGKGIVPAIHYGNNAAAGHYAQVNGIKIYYEIYGSGEPLLLLHGNRQSIASFSDQIPAFAQHFRVIAIDTRGQGKSTEDGKTYTYDLFAKDMNELLNYLQLDSVNIVGWSDGGNTGLIMAMKYPEKVKRLVTMGAVIFIDTSVVEPIVFDAVNNQLKDFSKDTSYALRNEWRLADMLLIYPKHTFKELETIQCPVLVMQGENGFIKKTHTEGIAEHIPHSTLMIVPGESHLFPVEDPKRFNKLVIDFLSGQKR